MNILTDTIERMACRKIAPLLVPYSDNRLGRDARARVEAHLSRCAACRDEVQAIAQVGALLRQQSAQEAANEAVDPTRFSKDLWAGIEAEIRRTERPAANTAANTEWSAEDLPVRPRSRWMFALDASWPNRVPVAVAVFSAAVFAMVLSDHHHAFVAPGASDTGNAAHEVQAIAVTVQPSATIPALAARSQTSATANPGAKASAYYRSSTTGMARLATVTTHHSRIVVGSESAVGSVVGASSAAPASLATVAQHLALVGDKAASDRLASVSRATAPRVDASPSHLPATLGVTAVSDASAYPALAAVSDAASVKTDEASVTVSGVSSARTIAARHVNSTENSPEAIASKPAADADDATATLVSSAAASHDDDATVRGDSPAAEPMADFAVLARRQRNLFSYTSR